MPDHSTQGRGLHSVFNPYRGLSVWQRIAGFGICPSQEGFDIASALSEFLLASLQVPILFSPPPLPLDPAETIEIQISPKQPHESNTFVRSKFLPSAAALTCPSQICYIILPFVLTVLVQYSPAQFTSIPIL